MDIFVGSLPFKLKENELKELFEKHGEVSSAKIIIDKETRQNKGFGFVEMPNEEEALKAIGALNGSEVMGRMIKVNKSEKREPGSGGSSFRGDAPRRPSFNRDSSAGGSQGGGGTPGFNRDSSGGFNRDSNSGTYNKESSGGFNKDSGSGFNRGGGSNYRDGGNSFNKGGFKGGPDKNKDSKGGGFNKGGAKGGGYPKKRRGDDDDDDL